MRLPTTLWIAAYVDDRGDAGGCKQASKVGGRAGAVADGPEEGTWAPMCARWCHWLGYQKACGMFRTFDLMVSITSAPSPANTSFVMASAIPRT